jgi:hypothetical protein
MWGFRWLETGGRQLFVVNNQLFRHYGGIDHCDFERVSAGDGKREKESDFTD